MTANRKASSLWAATLSQAVDTQPLEQDTRADLVIVGGGYSGCSAALHAAARGMTVCLLEAQSIGYGGSGRNVGLVNAGLWLPPKTIRAQLGAEGADRLNALLMDGPEYVFSLIEKYSIECEATRAGTLHCAHSARGLADLEERQRQLQEIGSHMELLSAKETAARTGSEAFHGALFNPGAGTIQPLAYCQGLARAAQTQGAQLHEHSPALSINRTAGEWVVQTTQARVNARFLLMVTNAYHVPATGMRAASLIPMHFFQMATEPLAADVGASILPAREGCWDTAMIMSSFRRDAAGRLIIGGIGSLEHAGKDIHRDWAERKLTALFPQLAGQKLQYAWTGRIAMTTDHIPKIQRIGDNGLSLFGYSGRGIAPGSLFGKAAVDALATKDFTSLPLPLVDDYRITFTGARQIGYEMGATAAHLLTT